MLGERARTAADADRYFSRYMSAIEAVGNASPPRPGLTTHELLARPSISVKLSAIHPRFDPGKEERLVHELLPRIVELATAARWFGLGLTIDAEEQDRLDMTLGLFAAAFTDPALAGWPGLGLAVQAYGKRAIPVLRWLRRLSSHAGKQIPVRLVKGAYWDSEIKWAQERGLPDYPVLTRKLHTDVSYLACLRLLLSDPERVLSAVRHPQRAIHRCRQRRRARHARPTNSSACTAWARRCTRRWSAGPSWVLPAASTRRSALTRTWSPISCGACSRTGPTHPSSIGWPTRKRRSRRS